MFIDTHAHLNFKAFDKDLEEVIDQTIKAGIDKIIIPGAKIDSSIKALEIAQKYDSCFAAVGIHPHHIDEFVKLGIERVKEELKKMLKSPPSGGILAEAGQVQHDKITTKVVAIGEVGLDYHEYKGYPAVSPETKEQQKELLITQMEIARDYNLPVIFHCRDAYDDQLRIIHDYVKSGGKQIAGVFHCFGGDKKHLKEILAMGFYVGFDGNITYPENTALQELVRLTPVDRLLLETDSPYLTPVPFRGQRNTPAYLNYIAVFVSGIHHVSRKELAEITTQNALNLFRLS